MSNYEEQMKEHVVEVVRVLNDKKASDIQVLALTGLSSVTDYFVICTGNSAPHIKTLADYADEKLEERGVRRLHMEGYDAANWVLLDYGEIVVHIFHKEQRGFYSLERLWSDAPFMDISDYID